jgi:hypothetical protein
MTDLHLTELKARQEWMQTAALSDIAGHAEGIRFNARQIISSPYSLQWQEPFRTRMEAEIEAALDAIRLASEALQNKLDEYRKLPVKNAA